MLATNENSFLAYVDILLPALQLYYHFVPSLQDLCHRCSIRPTILIFSTINMPKLFRNPRISITKAFHRESCTPRIFHTGLKLLFVRHLAEPFDFSWSELELAHNSQYTINPKRLALLCAYINFDCCCVNRKCQPYSHSKRFTKSSTNLIW
jgi:hypothetical protein